MVKVTKNYDKLFFLNIIMLLLKLSNKKNNRFTTKTPFFLFFKGSYFKHCKGLLKKKDSIFHKKFEKISYLCTTKSKSWSSSVLSDGNSFSVERSSTNLVTKGVNNIDNMYRSLKEVGSLNYFKSKLHYVVDYNSTGCVFRSLKNLIDGTSLYNGSNGNYIEVVYSSITLGHTIIKLPSGFLKKIPLLSVGYLGRSSGIFFNIKYIGKFRFSTKKKSVRGVAMNPVDHPNGGRSNVKQPFMNRYGKLAKNGK